MEEQGQNMKALPEEVPDQIRLRKINSRIREIDDEVETLQNERVGLAEASAGLRESVEHELKENMMHIEGSYPREARAMDRGRSRGGTY